LIEKTNLFELEKKPVNEMHGEKVLYQILWGAVPQGTKTLKSITAVARITIPPHETNLIHNHPKDEQVYILIEGGGIVQVGDEKTDAREGDVIVLPVNIPHAFYNTSDSQCIILNVSVRVPQQA
jgi:quercetin dioxygenase-like cupin family protein